MNQLKEEIQLKILKRKLYKKTEEKHKNNCEANHFQMLREIFWYSGNGQKKKTLLLTFQFYLLKMLKHFRVAKTSIEEKLNYYSNHNTNNERKFTITLIAKHKNNFSWDKKECLLYKTRPGQSADQHKNIICDQDHTKML